MRVQLLVAALFACGCGSTHDGVDAAVSDASADDAPSDVDASAPVCHSNADCTPDMFCIVPCKTTGDPQTCQPRPTCDDAGSAAACGCDGHVYDSACLAMASGVTPAPFASLCPAPQGTFACGLIYCDVGTYCQTVGGPTPHPDTCGALPPACVGSTDCACFGDAGGCGTCTFVADAGFRWSCVID